MSSCRCGSAEADRRAGRLAGIIASISASGRPTDAAAARMSPQVASSIGMPSAARRWRVAASTSPGSSTGAAGSAGGDAFTQPQKRMISAV